MNAAAVLRETLAQYTAPCGGQCRATIARSLTARLSDQGVPQPAFRPSRSVPQLALAWRAPPCSPRSGWLVGVSGVPSMPARFVCAARFKRKAHGRPSGICAGCRAARDVSAGTATRCCISLWSSPRSLAPPRSSGTRSTCATALRDANDRAAVCTPGLSSASWTALGTRLPWRARPSRRLISATSVRSAAAVGTGRRPTGKAGVTSVASMVASPFTRIGTRLGTAEPTALPASRHVGLAARRQPADRRSYSCKPSALGR